MMRSVQQRTPRVVPTQQRAPGVVITQQRAPHIVPTQQRAPVRRRTIWQRASRAQQVKLFFFKGIGHMNTIVSVTLSDSILSPLTPLSLFMARPLCNCDNLHA